MKEIVQRQLVEPLDHLSLLQLLQRHFRQHLLLLQQLQVLEWQID